MTTESGTTVWVTAATHERLQNLIPEENQGIRSGVSNDDIINEALDAYEELEGTPDDE